jgi:peptidoglycan/xylan/chitin deacetylase (PgdA/CDA1 family)
MAKTVNRALPVSRVVSLPQYFRKSEGALLEGFQTLTGWSKSSNTAISLDTVNYKIGVNGIQMAATAAYPEIIKNGFSFANVNQFGLWVYVPDATALDYIALYLSSSSGFATNFARTWTASRQLKNGWNWLVMNKADFINTGGEVWGNCTYLKLKVWKNASASSVTVTYGALYTNPVLEPKIIINFDDAFPSVYTKAYSILHAAGVAGTFYINSNRVGLDGYISLAQLQEMYADGWDIANHTADHTNLTTLATDAEIITAIQTCTDYLIAQGFTRAAYQLSYPFGGVNRHIQDVVKSIGILSARSTYDGTNGILYDYQNLYDIPKIVSLDQNTTNDTIHSHVDELVTYGGTGFFYGHIIKDDPAGADYTVATSVLQELVNYAVLKGIEIITISEWYRRLTNPCKLIA